MDFQLSAGLRSKTTQILQFIEGGKKWLKFYLSGILLPVKLACLTEKRITPMIIIKMITKSQTFIACCSLTAFINKILDLQFP